MPIEMRESTGPGAVPEDAQPDRVDTDNPTTPQSSRQSSPARAPSPDPISSAETETETSGAPQPRDDPILAAPTGEPDGFIGRRRGIIPDHFIPATVVVSIESWPELKNPKGVWPPERIKPSFLNAVEDNIVSLEPGDVSFDYEGRVFHGKVILSPRNEYIIHGSDVSIEAIESVWSLVVSYLPEKQKPFANLDFHTVVETLDDFNLGGLRGRYACGRVNFDPDHVVLAKVKRTTWGEWFGRMAAWLHVR